MARFMCMCVMYLSLYQYRVSYATGRSRSWAMCNVTCDSDSDNPYLDICAWLKLPISTWYCWCACLLDRKAHAPVHQVLIHIFKPHPSPDVMDTRFTVERQCNKSPRAYLPQRWPVCQKRSFPHPQAGWKSPTSALAYNYQTTGGKTCTLSVAQYSVLLHL